jgi:hypothetical protein
MARQLRESPTPLPPRTGSLAVRNAKASAILHLSIYSNHHGWTTVPLTVLPELDATFQPDDYMRVGPFMSDRVKAALAPLASKHKGFGMALLIYVLAYENQATDTAPDQEAHDLMDLIKMELPTHIRICGHCQRRGLRLDLCSGCKTVSYCGTSCQKSGWSKHKVTCQGK